MRKKLFRTLLLLLLLACALGACKKQTEPAGPGDNEPVNATEQKPEPAPEPELEEEPPVSVEAEASAATADILVNGNKVSIGAYNIDGSNYVSIRDLAYVLDGSRASFDVGWDAGTKSIALTTGRAYTPAGGELAGAGSGKASAWSIVSPVLLNGEETMLDGYTVGNVSYFSLKKMSEVLDFSMGWFSELRYVVINTEKPCGEDPLTLEEEYQLIVDSRPAYAPAVEGLCEADYGLCYADHIDFDHDGQSELLLVSLDEYEKQWGGPTISATIEVYGASDGHAAPYGKFEEEFTGSYYGYVGVNEFRSATFICTGREFKSSHPDPTQLYYGIQDKALALKYEAHFGDDGEDRWLYYSADGQELPEEQYKEIDSEHVKRTPVLSTGYGAFVENSGILSIPLEPSITVNGEKIDFGMEYYPESPFLHAENSRLIAPMRPVLEAMGISVYSNANGTVIVASTKKDTLTIMDGGWLMWGMGDETDTNWGLYEGNIEFNGEEQSIPVIPEYFGKQLFVPVSSIVRMFGAKAEWDEPARTLRITSDIPAGSRMSADEMDRLINGFSPREAMAIAERAGYVYTSFASDVYDYFHYRNGKAYYSFYTVPAGVSPYENYTRYHTTVGSDGSISVRETTYNPDTL